MEKISSVKYFTFLLFFSTILLAQNIFALTGQAVDSWVFTSTPTVSEIIGRADGLCIIYAEKGAGMSRERCFELLGKVK